MKREDFIRIIKIRSAWKIDRRKGNYKLPSGNSLRSYVYALALQQLNLDHLGIGSDGNLYSIDSNQSRLMIPFAESEPTTPEEQDARFSRLVRDII